MSRRRLEGYRRAGVNRISLGVQSLDDRILPRLNRLHSARQAHQAFEAAREAGFDNISADLIYGLPGLDGPVWERTVRDVLGWEPDHFSAYALTLDEGSLWHAAGVTDLPDEDEITGQYWALTRLAREAGYEHYEVSNYARPGRRSAHNQIYWHAEEYLGAGTGRGGLPGRCPLHQRQAGRAVLHARRELRRAGRDARSAHRPAADRRAPHPGPAPRRTAFPPPGSTSESASSRGDCPRSSTAWRERGLLVEDGGRARLTEEGFLLSDALFVELL